MSVIIGLFLLGLLVGNLTGLSAQSVVTPLMGLLFAFVGGSVIAFLGKLPATDRRLAGQCVIALSLGCLIGTYAGIVVTEYQLLSPKGGQVVAARKTVAGPHSPKDDQVAAARETAADPHHYVRSQVFGAAAAIHLQYAQNHISIEEAYRQLQELLQKDGNEVREP